ncbi:CDP-glycerol glycerophosphotransferase family protein [Fibrobacter sp. UWH1]|uniref:CDP-glycerol glycerophosphotransferase family protein n=1 Tax=Fibrobacter sp. UWH1 TaxID=1964354 RepID=UPI000B51F6C7|nr:CDP-glycerol glycerophosphotransferase family protein [Fibrobacter sp. UWH1]OWV12141.1 hypothetical protein B7992_09750 [Fibrobacter sp. UWH1]
MRSFIIKFLKIHPRILVIIWTVARYILQFCSIFVPVNKKQILFASFGGRKFDDSPKAIYDEICRRKEFADWNLIWAFVNPQNFDIPRGKKIRMDSFSFFIALLQSYVWVSNSGMDRDIFLNLKHTIKVETWHGTPLKKICGDEHQNTMGGKRELRGPLDSRTIRCAQSVFDRDIFKRIFHATENSFLMCDLPRNDKLRCYTERELIEIKQKLNIPLNKKVILYAPTYREYLWDENGENLLVPPINLGKWERKLASEYVLLFRAHYAVGTALNVQTNDFVKDVSSYPVLNDLYAISDMMISDYSSCYFDFSILHRPMLNFAYDLEEYETKRGLYLKLEDCLECSINRDEDSLLSEIKSLDFEQEIMKTIRFQQRFAPFAGHASEVLVDEILKRV